MRAVLLFMALSLVAGTATHREQRIVGGSETTIDQYPSIAALLHSYNYAVYEQRCGGVIINARSILTAAHCPFNDVVNRWRVRVGSNYPNSGGAVHIVQSYIIHYDYNYWTADNDMAIMRTASVIAYNSHVQAGRVAGTNYKLLDNELVWAAGWGATVGPSSVQLRHVQGWTINQAACAERYAGISESVTGNMLCAGWLDVGGRGHCSGDAGGPLYHNTVVVGIASWGEKCLAAYPTVNVRVSKFTDWIRNNA